MAETQRDMTPMQKFVYVKAKSFHEEDYKEKTPNNVNKAHGALKHY